jgi:predicted esterase
MRAQFALLFALAVVLGSAAPHVRAADALEKKAPDGKAGNGKVYEGKTADGVVYNWRGPSSYDPEKGVGLTVIIHGSNLTRGWGFANHSKDTFRPDDLVVSPDGTTPNGQGGFNNMDSPADVKKFAALLAELKKAYKVRGTYLYGHSQGSFFALKYAGDRPEDVDGVVAHASGMWMSTQANKNGHHQAIVLMHGTQDPVVPYDQSVGGYAALKEAGYPMLRLRSLEGWNHWPAEHNGDVPHTSQQLAWVEGMTTKDPERLATCFELLADVKVKEEHDWAGLYRLAKHVESSAIAPAALKQRAQKAAAAVEALAQSHADALAVKPGTPFEKKAWVGHLPIFLRSFMDVPAREALAASWKDALEEHQKVGVAHLRKYFPAMRKNDATEAFEEGVAAIVEGFLHYECADAALRENLAKWEKDAKKNKLSKKAVKDYEAVVKGYGAVLKDGWEAFAALNRKGDAS